MSYFIDMFKNYVNFSGRATRKQFWCAYGIWFAIYMVLYILSIVGGFSVSTQGADMSAMSGIGMLFLGLMMLFALGTFLPVLAIQIRRLRDAGFQWWVWLLCFIGSCACGIGSIVLLVLLCFPTKNPENTDMY